MEVLSIMLDSIEGFQIFENVVDVVVCDGLSAILF